MFSFFSKKIKPIRITTTLKIDIHSHLIPGIDDGSKSMEESIALLKILSSYDYEKVITTPHIMFDAYGNTKDSILLGLKKLQEEVKKHNIPIEVEAAAEYYLDEGLEALIEKKEVLLIDNKYMLFETSYTHRPMQLEETIFSILSSGFIPLLAHPERYRYIKNPKKEYAELKNLGVLFQINLNSFNGMYGKNAKKNALYLSQAGLISFLGTDTHHVKHANNLAEVFKSKEYASIFEKNIILNNLL